MMAIFQLSCETELAPKTLQLIPLPLGPRASMQMNTLQKVRVLYGHARTCQEISQPYDAKNMSLRFGTQLSMHASKADHVSTSEICIAAVKCNKNNIVQTPGLFPQCTFG